MVREKGMGRRRDLSRRGGDDDAVEDGGNGSRRLDEARESRTKSTTAIYVIS